MSNKTTLTLPIGDPHSTPVLKMIAIINRDAEVVSFALETIDGGNPEAAAMAAYKLAQLRTEFPKQSGGAS